MIGDDIPVVTDERFWALPDNEKRLAVAKDVLKQLKLNKYHIGESVFAALTTLDDIYRNHIHKISQDTVKDSDCHVCALGACLVSTVRLGDRIAIDNDPTIDLFSTYLSQVFPFKTMIMLEWLFEQGGGVSRIVKTDDGKITGRLAARLPDTTMFTEEEYRDLDDVYCYFRSLTKIQRLRWLMQNIVDNNGDFIPNGNKVTDSATNRAE